MNGALFQLLRNCPQDKYLTLNPEITFFKNKVNRYANFSILSITQQFTNPTEWGGSNFVEISKTGDLVYRMYLEIDIPEIPGNNKTYIGRWTDKLGLALLEYISVELNSVEIDRHTGEFLDIFSQLSIPESRTQGYYSMIGHTDALCGPYAYKRPATTLRIPLQFWFCRDPFLAFPIRASSHTIMRILTKFRKFSEVWINLNSTQNYDTYYDDTSAQDFPIDSRLYIEYIYLDQMNSQRYTQGKQEYIIEQTQMSLSNTVVPGSPMYEYSLNFTNPIKCLFWTFQKQSNIESPSESNSFIGNQWTNYSAESYNPEYTLFNNNPCFKYMPNFYPTLQMTATTVLDVDVLTYNNMSCLDLDPMDTCTFIFDNIERFSPQKSEYFNKIQSYQCFERCPDSTGIYVYSFALKPDRITPTGAFNFSGLQDIRIHFTMKDTVVNTKCIWPSVLIGDPNTNLENHPIPSEISPSIWNRYLFRNAGYYYETLNDEQTTYNLHIYAMNYNVLKVSRGIASIEFNS